MKINFIDSFDSKFDYKEEGVNIFSNLMFADSLYYFSSTSFNFYHYKYLKLIPEDKLLDLFEQCYELNESEVEMVSNLRKDYHNYKKFKNQKHRDKSLLISLGRVEHTYKNIRNDLKDFFDNCIRDLHHDSLLPFFEENIIDIFVFDHTSSEINENKFLSFFVKIILNPDEIFSVDSCIDQDFSSYQYDEDDEENSDIIYVPLWSFPQLQLLTPPQLRYTREDLKPAFAAFEADFKTFVKEIRQISFAPEDHQKLQQLCAEKLVVHIEKVQQQIDQSLYITKLNHEFPNDTKQRFNVGITSIESLLDFYECEEVIGSYMTTEIKSQVARYYSLDTCYPFSFYQTIEANETQSDTKPLFDLLKEL